MTILVTGSGGFIGSAISFALLERGDEVVGLDDINDYYDTNLKLARLSRLKSFQNFSFVESDITNFSELQNVFQRHGQFSHVVHLAANAGVRYSQDFPLEVVNSNIVGHANLLELCRCMDEFEHFVFASSASVYADDEQVPYNIDSRINSPRSVYAATKAADELISYVYSHNFGMKQTALRFFTVYGPWGRPDMAYYLFTDLIAKSKPIQVFNFGDMRRDFVHINDAVQGIILSLDNPPSSGSGDVALQKFNIGSGQSESLHNLISQIEKHLNMRAIRNLESGPRGEMTETLADISLTRSRLGFSPSVSFGEGIENFVEWYRNFHAI